MATGRSSSWMTVQQTTRWPRCAPTRGSPGVTVLARANGGKASALNAGLRSAAGDIILFVDADGIFEPDTVEQLLAAFENDRVGAVCGSDSPANLDRLLTRLANLQTHVGTGFARRALSVINCLPIVSGNLGAFRRSVLSKTGPFREGFIGEDLELTWRVHRRATGWSSSPGQGSARRRLPPCERCGNSACAGLEACCRPPGSIGTCSSIHATARSLSTSASTR